MSQPATGDDKRPPCPETEIMGDPEEEGMLGMRPARMVVRMYFAKDYQRHLIIASATRTLEALQEAAASGMIPPDPILEAVGMESLTGAEVMRFLKLTPPSAASPSPAPGATKVSLRCMYNVKDQSMEGLVDLARRKTRVQSQDILIQMDGSSRWAC